MCLGTYHGDNIYFIFLYFLFLCTYHDRFERLLQVLILQLDTMLNLKVILKFSTFQVKVCVNGHGEHV